MVNTSVRASPPPITDGQSMPKGAIISPPESSASSDDDDLPEVRGRTIENLKELHDAISQIPVHRESSPTKSGVPAAPDAGDLLVLPSQAATIAQGMHHSFSTSSLDDLAHPSRRISHTRSVTEPHVLVTKSAENSLTASEEDTDEEILRKPQMVRKKSGELVRPALRPPSRRRPSSMPGTPTFSKAVHFDSHLEHVRHFLQVDRPLAVSAGSSPVENYDSDNEYPFPGDERGVRSPPFEWEIIINNFPLDTPARKAQPVRLERVWLSTDQKCLIGSVAVANLAFQKSVTCRFTLDYWKTTSEIAAEYMSEIRSNEPGPSHDRFNFTIKLSDLANLESKTLYFAIRYNVNGQEHWDNNNGTNFQVDFRKKMLPQNGKKGVIGAANRPANALPRSNRRASPSSVGRPKSMPVAFDEFGDNPKIDFDQSIHDYLGEGPTSLRLKGVKSSTSIPSDNLSTRLSAPSGQAFANRYDFGASLSAAMLSAKDSPTKPDGLYMKPNQRKATPPPPAATVITRPQPPKVPAPTNQTAAVAAAVNKVLPAVQGASGAGSPASPSIASSSYEELVNKYCFFGSKQSSPTIKDGTLKGGRFDGSDDVFMTRSTNSSNSSSHSSPRVSGPQHIHGAQHHTLHPKDPNPYFQHATQFMAIGASPATSPLGNPMNRTSSPSAGQPRSAAPVSGQSSGRSPSPASMVGSFQPFTGTSPNDFAYDRFPFSGTEAHAATAIRG